MRNGVRLNTVVLCAIATICTHGEPTNASPLRHDANIHGKKPVVQLVGDNCWWSGTRWQYGWRGYGWYWCWEDPKPAAPVAIAPESVPESAIVMPDPCLRTWQDKTGKLRSRRVC